ncbi:amidohydrolase [Flavobacterium agrisoli]|uniref:Omega-amidase YafV n=1 Tax=Flavobacterium agrisoli TaxID=2793066 RepID=A0A934UJU9_9FLAO|nr:amidohydrolase [Flavobacterium agrisoli]MBK0369795.1 amidohydrolase [Flavobacterium agrisoli]
MKVALLQSSLIWENPTANRNLFEQKIKTLISEVNLVVLPEMFTTGFTMNAKKMAEKMNGETVLWMQKIAVQKKIAITGSLIIEENDNFYNRLLFVFPNGEWQYYDKRHLFTLAHENEHYTKGNSRLLVSYLGFKICPLICYDLRFPVFSRNNEDFDVLLYVANWPTVRIKAWDVLLQARAIENVCYAVGVNRVGLDGHGYEHTGHSQVHDCLGEPVLVPQEAEGVFIVDLDKKVLEDTRKNKAFLKDQDDFSLRL